jgi:hypothetical protein
MQASQLKFLQYSLCLLWGKLDVLSDIKNAAISENLLCTFS